MDFFIFISIFVSAFFSVSAILCYFWDLFFGGICFQEVAVIALGTSLLLCLKLITAETDSKLKLKTDLFLVGIFILSSVYFIFPSAPDLFPLGLSWDGTNHIALINQLKETGGHSAILREHFSLPWGGTLFAYAWGMHAVFASLSKLFDMDAFLLIHPVMFFISALIVTSLASFLKKCGFMRYAILLTLLIILFSPFVFYPLFCFAHWSQLAGILLGLSLLYVLDFCSEKRQYVVLPVVLMLGIFMIYPIFAMVFYPGLVYVLIKKKYHTRNVLIVLMPVLLTALLYMGLYSYPSLVKRTLMRSGEGFPDLKTSLMGFAICFGASVASVFLFLKKKSLMLVFPLIAIVEAGLLFWLLYPYKIRDYFFLRLFSLDLILLVPPLCFLIDALLRYVKKRLGQKGFVGILVLIFLACFIIYPRTYLWNISPSLTKYEYKMALKVNNTMGGKRVFYMRRNKSVAMKSFWLMAIFPKMKIEVPCNRHNNNAVIDYIYKQSRAQYRMPKVMRYMKFGDLILWCQKAKPLNNRFCLIGSEGNVSLYEFNPRGYDHLRDHHLGFQDREDSV